jgi:hypothetical protein
MTDTPTQAISLQDCPPPSCPPPSLGALVWVDEITPTIVLHRSGAPAVGTPDRWRIIDRDGRLHLVPAEDITRWRPAEVHPTEVLDRAAADAQSLYQRYAALVMDLHTLCQRHTDQRQTHHEEPTS